MKNKSTSITRILVVLFFLVSIFFSTTACEKSTVPNYWQRLSEDETWIQTVNKFLGLAYVEMNDNAAFTWRSINDLAPSLYSTYAVMKILKSSGVDIDKQDRIIEHIDNLRNVDGSYSDPYQNIKEPANEIRQSLSVMTELGAQPKDIISTVDYLLSLQYEDGTFLTGSQAENSGLENTKLKRISRGTASVVLSLIMLGSADKIPQNTKEVIFMEVSSNLGESGPFPDLMDYDTWRITVAIEILAKMDPSLVTERAKEFIVYALTGLLDMPEHTYLFASRANRLLDIADLTDVSEAYEKSVLDGLRHYLKEKIFPLQNSLGGFGPPNSIEPLTTSENVILANRLGVTCPNFNKLISEIEKHRVNNGWAVFFDTQINNSGYIFTRYALEIARFSGYDGYDKSKLEVFLRQSFSDGVEPVGNGVNLSELYHAVMALKTLTGELSTSDKKLVEEQLSRLTQNFNTMSKSDYNTQFLYVTPISEQAGFDITESTVIEITRLAGYYKEDIITRNRSMLPQSLCNLWKAQVPENEVISQDEVMQYLSELYDEETGGYNSLMINKLPASSEEIGSEPEYVPHPEIFQTYSALELLHDLGEKIPNKDKTYNFVMGCKSEYGFSRAPNLPGINLEATFAAIKILEQL
jgi:hypothetical protein